MTRWESIGLLFDIDALLEANKRHMQYGQQARLIFMRHFDPVRIRTALLWHGDSEATIAGLKRHWCIAVTPENPRAIDAFRDMFDGVEAPGLLPRPERFIIRPIDVIVSASSIEPVRTEPLDRWFAVDDQGVIDLADPIDEDVVLCTRFGRPYRLPNRLADFVARIHAGTIAPRDISGSEELTHVSAVFAAVDIEREGVPRTLLRLAKAYTDNGSDIYARYCVGQLLPSLDWSEDKLARRVDHTDVRAATDYLKTLGYGPRERTIIRCPNGHQLRVPIGKSGKIRCPNCDIRFDAST